MSSKNTNNGIGLTGILFIVFLVLKLTGNIDWSWWWVTSPLWIPLAFFVSMVVFVFTIFMLLLAIGFDFASIKDKFENIVDKFR